MKAAIYKGPHETVIEEIPIPELGPKDILVKVVKAGICGSDITAWKVAGLYAGIKDDSQWGHEFSGIVDKVGSEVTDFAPGDRVWVNPDQAKRIGSTMCCMVGAFSEYVNVEDAELGFNVFKLADNVSFEEAALIEPYCVGTGGKNAIDCQVGDKVIVYGDGTIGLCALSALVAQGVKDVVVIGMIESRLKLAKEMGALAVCNAGEQDVHDFLVDIWGVYPGDERKINADKWIDCVGIDVVINNFMQMAKPKSKIAIVGIYKAPVEINLMLVMAHEYEIVGSCAYDTNDIREVIAAIEEKRTPIRKIVTHTFPYDQLTDALDQSLDLDTAIKVLVDYGVE